MKAFIAIVFCLFIPVQLHADPILQRSIDGTQQFVKENPVKVQQVDESGLVDLWQQIESLHGMIWLYSEGTLPPTLKPEVHKRISANQMQTRNMGFHDDPMVRALAALVRLHADIAASHLRGHVEWSDYVAVASYSKTHGRLLAQAVEKKFSKGKKILRESAPLKPW